MKRTTRHHVRVYFPPKKKAEPTPKNPDSALAQIREARAKLKEVKL